MQQNAKRVGRQASEPNPGPDGTTTWCGSRMPKEQGDKPRNPTQNQRNQEMMTEQKAEKIGRQPYPEPDGNRKWWWNRTPKEHTSRHPACCCCCCNISCILYFFVTKQGAEELCVPKFYRLSGCVHASVFGPPANSSIALSGTQALLFSHGKASSSSQAVPFGKLVRKAWMKRLGRQHGVAD